MNGVIADEGISTHILLIFTSSLVISFWIFLSGRDGYDGDKSLSFEHDCKTNATGV